MSYLTPTLLQSFLEDTKMTITEVDPNLESFAINVTFGRLSVRYDTTAWTSTATTPSMALQLAAMKYCAIAYRRQYSEDLEEDNNYAVYLDKSWGSILDSITTGDIDITSVPESATSGPVYWPTDASTDLADTDPENSEAAVRFATMGMVF